MIARGKEAAALALHRFGFGPARGEIAAIADDPRGAVLADLDRPLAGTIDAGLPTSSEAARAVFDFQAAQQARQKLTQRMQKPDAGGVMQVSNEAASEANNQAMAAITADLTAGQKPGENQPPLPRIDGTLQLVTWTNASSSKG